MKDFEKLEEKLQIQFRNKHLLKQAFTHRSYLNENSKLIGEHNERLEFLGDAVLELVVTENLFLKFPEKPEGDLTAYRASLVNTSSLSESANDLGLNDFLLLSRGEAKDMGKARQYILANTFEALVGALYLDNGYEHAKNFILKTLFPKLSQILKDRLWQDAKSHLQEKAQEIVNITPTYRVLHEEGPDHDKKFTVGVFLNNELVGEGDGHSKQEAEQHAAEEALKEKRWN